MPNKKLTKFKTKRKKVKDKLRQNLNRMILYQLRRRLKK